MARMPGAEWVGPHHDNGNMTRYDIVCVHTIVGNPPAHAAHFSTRWDGHLYQSRDTMFKSVANFNGNHRVIAIENDDWGSEFGDWGGDPRRVPGFTDAQIETNAQVCAWAHRVHGIPLALCPNSKPGSRGIAYHRQGIDGNWSGYAYGGRVPGGEVWTKSPGKACPGDRRIKQLIERIIPRARQIAGLDPVPQVPRREDPNVKNLILAQEEGGVRTYVGDGMFRRWVQDPVELAGLQYWIGQKGGSPAVETGFRDLRVLGIDIVTEFNRLADDEASIIEAVRGIVAADADATVELKPEDVDRFAAAILETVPPSIADAVRAAFARAGQS